LVKITLIYPRWNYPTFGQLQEPLGIMCIGAALRAEGHEVGILDLAVDDIEELDRAVEEVDLIGMSSSTALYGRACLLLDRIRERRPDLPVVIGGPHATVLPEETLARGFDAVAIGEGEHTAVELARALEKDSPLFEVPGMVAMSNGEVRHGPARRFEPELDIFADADRSMVNYEKYYEKQLTNIGMMATRGCPWNCLFCKPMQDKLFGRKVRRRSIGRIVGEMKRIEEVLGKKRYLFRDDTLVLAGADWFVEFEQELNATGLEGASWSCQARVDQITRPLIEQMKRCGLEGVAFGVESGSQRVLDFFRKGIKVEQTVRAFDICHEMGIGTHAFIMLGAPVETREDLEATVRLVERIRSESISVSITTPAPGTDLYRQVQESGLLNLSQPEDSDYHYNREPIKLPHLSVKDLAWAEAKIIEASPGTYFRDQLEERMRALDGPD
jgi:radical SAM superfamily enzyme YgiQ (UPF0313 family)